MDKTEFTGTITSDYHTRLRDEIAMLALQGILSNNFAKLDKKLAEEAYKWADIMITARSQTKPSG